MALFTIFVKGHIFFINSLAEVMIADAALLMFPDQEHKNCQSNWAPNWLQASAWFKLPAISWSRSKIFEKSSLFKAQLVGYSIFTR